MKSPRAPGEIADLEREVRILRKKLARSETNRRLLEESLASHMELLRVRNAELAADRNACQAMNSRLRRDIKQESQEKAKINERLYRLDRLNLIGEIAASIGHEVRNPLTTVRGYLQFFEGKSGFADYGDALRLMIEELDRANAIISDFLSLAKNKRPEPRPGNLKDVLAAIRPMLEADAIRLGHHVAFDLQDTPDIILDVNEIRQLVINLVRNGLEAMASPGRVTVTAAGGGEGVQLSISDSGPGIPPEIVPKLGTPFLTTKEKGSGLGLMVCHRIAEGHEAAITFESSPAGTTVTVGFRRLSVPPAGGDSGVLLNKRIV